MLALAVGADAAASVLRVPRWWRLVCTATSMLNGIGAGSPEGMKGLQIGVGTGGPCGPGPTGGLLVSSRSARVIGVVELSSPEECSSASASSRAESCSGSRSISGSCVQALLLGNHVGPSRGGPKRRCLSPRNHNLG